MERRAWKSEIRKIARNLYQKTKETISTGIGSRSKDKESPTHCERNLAIRKKSFHHKKVGLMTSEKLSPNNKIGY